MRRALRPTGAGRCVQAHALVLCGTLRGSLNHARGTLLLPCCWLGPHHYPFAVRRQGALLHHRRRDLVAPALRAPGDRRDAARSRAEQGKSAGVTVQDVDLPLRELDRVGYVSGTRHDVGPGRAASNLHDGEGKACGGDHFGYAVGREERRPGHAPPMCGSTSSSVACHAPHPFGVSTSLRFSAARMRSAIAMISCRLSSDRPSARSATASTPLSASAFSSFAARAIGVASEFPMR